MLEYVRDKLYFLQYLQLMPVRLFKHFKGFIRNVCGLGTTTGALPRCLDTEVVEGNAKIYFLL